MLLAEQAPEEINRAWELCCGWMMEQRAQPWGLTNCETASWHGVSGEAKRGLCQKMARKEF